MRHEKRRLNESNIVFIVASDRPNWCKLKFKANVRFDVVHTIDYFKAGFGNGLNAAEFDFAILASNRIHSMVFLYGTFAFWAAYLDAKRHVWMGKKPPGSNRITDLGDKIRKAKLTRFHFM